MILCLLMAALLQADDAGADGAAWRYIVPAPGEPHEHPPLRALAMGNEPPGDVVETVAYRGRRRKYGQLRFGSPSSVRVTIVLDEVGPGEADLYVDADRNRRIEPEDRVEGDGGTWRTPLEAAIVEGESTTPLPRAMVFRRGSTGLTFSSAAAGYLEGKLRVGDRGHRARRMDGDGNGLLTDAQDRLWIDLDDDGSWDPTAEQFLYAPILSIDDGRFAVRSDPLGQRLTLAPLEGTGTVRITCNRPDGTPAITGLSATLIGRDGTVVGLDGDGSEATVPAGEYRVGTFIIHLDDPGGGSPWTFVFSDTMPRGEPIWRRVERDGALAVDPLGALTMIAEIEGDATRVGAGEVLSVRPGLFTGDGLRIVTCYRGRPTTPAGLDGPDARIAVRGGEGGPPLSAARSGFA